MHSAKLCCYACRVFVRTAPAYMEYNNVTFTAYLSAAIISGLLTLVFAYQYTRSHKSWLFAPAAAVHTLNLTLLAISFTEETSSSLLLLLLECMHCSLGFLGSSLPLPR